MHTLRMSHCERQSFQYENERCYLLLPCHFYPYSCSNLHTCTMPAPRTSTPHWGGTPHRRYDTGVAPRKHDTALGWHPAHTIRHWGDTPHTRCDTGVAPRTHHIRHWGGTPHTRYDTGVAPRTHDTTLEWHPAHTIRYWGGTRTHDTILGWHPAHTIRYWGGTPHTRYNTGVAPRTQDTILGWHPAHTIRYWGDTPHT